MNSAKYFFTVEFYDFHIYVYLYIYMYISLGHSSIGSAGTSIARLPGAFLKKTN